MGLFDFRLLSFIGIKETPRAPWKKYYNNTINFRVKDENIYQHLKDSIDKHKCMDKVAISYYGTKITYRTFLRKIDLCANKFLKMGVKKYDIVTILSANIPEALIAFYALNKIGAVANLLHPLLSRNEIRDAILNSIYK